MARYGEQTYQRLLETLDRAENGPVVDEKVFDDQQIRQTVRAVIQEFDIKLPMQSLVPQDDALADRMFEAGLELAARSGLLCMDTQRQMIWTRAELLEILADSPEEITMGSNDNAVRIRRRRPEEDRHVVVTGGPYGIPVAEDQYAAIVLSYLQEPSLELFEGPMLETVYGRPVRDGAPMEAVWCWREKELALAALEKVGKPGMSIGAAVGSASLVGELSSTTYGGFRKTDRHHLTLASELKVAYSELTKATHFQQTGTSSLGYYNPIFGGYGGGADGMGVLIVAGMIMMEACFGATFLDAAPGHAHLSCNSVAPMLTGQAVAFQALSRNTNLLVSSFIRPTAGPCVPHIFDEIAAVVLATVPSGIAHIEGVHTATGRFPAHCSGLEARFMAEVAHACEGLSRAEADRMARVLNESYKDVHKTIEKGKSFVECYDLESLQPTAEWGGMYAAALDRMHALGLNL
jgi:methylamine---corrinoid protein Co-methyltransferase